jgi:DNA helicase-2/ATP-dependent DNA helicase PcrA
LSGFYSLDRDSGNRYSDSGVDSMRRPNNGSESSRGYTSERYSDDYESDNRLPSKKSSSGSYGGSSSSGYSYNRDNDTSNVSPHLRNRASSARKSTSGSLPTVGSNTKPLQGTHTLPTFQVGDRVAHAKFGEGTVSQVLGDGDKAIYSIQFDTIAGKKLLDPKFAKLDKV